MKSSEVIDILKQNGWVLDRIAGSHHIFKNPLRIERQAGVKLKK